MRGLLLVILSFGVTICAWGLYGPVLHWGQADMAEAGLKYARLRPFICVGLAYFLIGVIVPAALLWLKGEQGSWTMTGIVQSLFGGALGAIGALGIIMAFNFGGRPAYVMPLVFGGAPVVNAFLTIYLVGKFKEVGPVFLAGLVMVVIGAVTVLSTGPKKTPTHVDDAAPRVEVAAETVTAEVASEVEQAGVSMGRFALQLLSIATVIGCWGAYGPVLHKGQAAMQHSRLRPLLCVGLAYFAIAVVVPTILLAGPMPEASSFANLSGTFWSLAAGAAGAIGALGIIMAFNFGGKPLYVMPLVFGGAPAVNTLFTATMTGAFEEISPLRMSLFLAGLMITIAGAAMVLVFAPKGPPPKKTPPKKGETKPAKTEDAAPKQNKEADRLDSARQTPAPEPTPKPSVVESTTPMGDGES